MFFKIKIYDLVKNLIDILIILFTCILSIKKGGYYISDSQFYINYIIIIFVIYVINEIFNWFNKRKNKVIDDESKIKSKSYNNKYIVIILAVMLAISYLLPIIFNVSIDIEEAMWEMLKYVVFAIIIYIVSNSNNKRLYLITIIIVAAIQVILGIDGISNRIFSDSLKNLNSGYLSKDLDRLSGTIQYANLTGLIFTISSVILLSYINNILSILVINKEKTSIELKKQKFNKIKLIFFNLLFMLFSICILLTKSKMILILYLIAILIILIKNKTSIKLNIIVNLLISFLASINIEDLIYVDSNKIYFTIFSYIVLNMIISNYIIKKIYLNTRLIKYYLEKKEKLLFKRNNFKYKGVIILLIIIVLFSILIQFKTTLNLTDKSKITNITRTYYSLNNNINNFNIKFNTKENSSFNITVYGILKNNSKEYLENHSLSNKSNIDICNIKVENKNYKAITLEFNNIKGNIEIDEIILNDKTKVIEYMLLPTDLIFRFKDVVHLNSTSITDRIEYNKDALKIWSESKLIGFGGEGFRHKYKDVQTYNYNSREVHNVYLQILVESGLIGVIIFITIIILTLKNKTNNYIKLTFILFIIHNIVDLNFSYLIGVVIFAILTGYILNDKINKI